MANVTVRYFAGARAAAGIASQTCDANTVNELLLRLAAEHGVALARILDVASLLVDGTIARDKATNLTDGQTVEVLPPFAGG